MLLLTTSITALALYGASVAHAASAGTSSSSYTTDRPNLLYKRSVQVDSTSSPMPLDMDPFASHDIVDVQPRTVPSNPEVSSVFAADESQGPHLGPGGNGMSLSGVMTTSSTLSSTALPATPSFAAPTMIACWSSDSCTHVLRDFAAAYQVSGDITDPNERGANGGTDQSRVFQARFCANTNYQESVYRNVPLAYADKTIVFSP